MTTSTMTQLAKKMTKHSEDVPWDEVLTCITAQTMEYQRRGEPVRELFSGGEAKKPEYILDPFVIKNYPSAIFGDPGSFKSNVALIINTLITLPWHDNPMGLIVPSKPKKVLYLDWETDEDTLLWQLTKIQKGMDLPPIPLIYRHCARSLAKEIEQIRTLIGECGADMIIGDSLGLAAGGDLKETQPALEFFAAFRELKITGLFLAHNAKDPEQKTKSIYGNMYYTAGMRNIWEIRKTQDEGADVASIALFHAKPPPFGKKRMPVGFKLIFTDDTTKIEQEDPKTVAEFVKRMSLKTRLFDSLKHGKSTAKALAEELEVSEGTIRTILNRNKIMFQKLDDGWGLASHHEERNSVT